MSVGFSLHSERRTVDRLASFLAPVTVSGGSFTRKSFPFPNIIIVRQTMRTCAENKMRADRYVNLHKEALENKSVELQNK